MSVEGISISFSQMKAIKHKEHTLVGGAGALSTDVAVGECRPAEDWTPAVTMDWRSPGEAMTGGRGWLGGLIEPAGWD